MDHFNYHGDTLHAEQVPLTQIASEFSTPCYVYSRATFERHWHAFDQALGSQEHLICYSVKANSNLAILHLLAKLGSGFDVVSVGELERVIAAGGDPAKTVFSGVGKQAHEIRRALDLGIYCFNVESSAELQQLHHIASELNKTARIAIRINPDVDPKTHPYISTGLHESKFGIDIQQAIEVYQQANTLSSIKIIGVDCHIGSQITTLQPFLDTLDRVLALIDQLTSLGITIQHLNLGGGLGVPYHDEEPPHPRDYANAVAQKLAGRNCKLLIEPGRAIAANAGILLTRVMLLKRNHQHHFAVVDAAMNDLLRPALYESWHTILPVERTTNQDTQRYHVVGPVCETGDFLGKSRQLAIKANDLLAIRSAGAYGFSMSSNYNSRPRVAEVLVDQQQCHLIRRRETIADLLAPEIIPSTL
jgi:diaminopimelate decarboxylase